MSHSDHTLQDAFRVKKGLHVTGVSVLSGDVAITGELRADNLEIPFETLSAKKIVWHDGLRDEQYVTLPGGNITTTTTWHPMSVIPDVYLYGTTQFRDVATFESDVHVQGDLHVDGNAYLSAGSGGVINVGDSTSDVVVFTADVNSHIIPNQNMTFDLGAADKHWQTIYTHDLSAHGSVDVTGSMSVTQNTQLNDTLNVAKRTTLHEDLHLSGAANIVGNTAVSGNTELSGTLTVDDATTINDTLDVELNTTLHGDLSVVNDTVLTGELSSKSDVHVFGDLRVDGDVWFNANNAGGTNTINLGDDNTDNVVFNADVDSNIIPNQNMTFDLGSDSQQWKELHVQDVSISQDLSSNRHVNFPNLSAGELSGNFVSIQSDGELTTSTVSVDAIEQIGTVVNATSANWDSVYASVTATSAEWDSVYSYVNDTSATNNPEFNDTRFVNVTGDTMTGTLNIQDTLSATGNVTFDSDLHLQGDLRVDGDVWFNANNTNGTNTINLGDDNTDNVVFNADVDSNIIPNQNMTFDLGTADKHWQTIYTHDLSAHGQLSATGAVHWSGGSSVSANDVYTTTNTYSADWQNVTAASKITQILTPTPGAVVDSYDHTHQKSAKYLIEVEDVSSGTGTSGAVFFTEMSVVTNGSVVSSVQYSQNYTTSDAFVEFFTTINGNDVEVKIRNINSYTNVTSCVVRINRQSTR